MAAERPPLASLAPLVTLLLSLPGEAALAEMAEARPWDPIAFLRSEAGVTPSELGSLARGQILAKVIDTDDKSEIFSLGAMRVKTTPARVIDVLRSVDVGPRAPWVLQIGRLGSVPSLAELEPLTLDAGDVKHLAKCRVNDCEVRLPADAIQKLRSELSGPAARRTASANALFRRTLWSYATAYLARGDAALFEYANNDDPVRIADSLRQLVRRMHFLREVAPDVHAFLERFPDARPDAARETLYWLKERFWLLNVVSLNHLAVFDEGAPSRRLVIAVCKQLYASHYYESSLGVTLFLEAQAPGPYLVFINRTRADIRRSGFSWLERTVLKILVRGRLEAQLKHLKLWLESP